jgi:hypothetical protein
MNFIRTDAKPHIYYLPKRPHENSDVKLEATQKLLEGKVSPPLCRNYC